MDDVFLDQNGTQVDPLATPTPGWLYSIDEWQKLTPKMREGSWRKYRKKQEQELAEQAKLPVGADGKRLKPLIFPEKTPKSTTVVPVAFVRSALFGMVHRGKRRQCNKERVFSNKDYEVYFSGIELDQHDLSTFMIVGDLYREENKYGVVPTRLSVILQRLGLKDSGQNRKTVMNRLERLTQAYVKIRSLRSRCFMAGTLFSSLVVDEKTGEMYIRPNVELQALLLGTEWQMLDRDVRQEISGDQLAMWLHAFFSTHEKPIPYTLEHLRKLCRSQTKELWRFKQQVKEAMTLWQAKDKTLLSWEIDDSDNLNVKRKRHPRAIPKPRTE